MLAKGKRRTLERGETREITGTLEEDIGEEREKGAQVMFFVFSLQKNSLTKLFFALLAIPGGIAEGPPKN